MVRTLSVAFNRKFSIQFFTFAGFKFQSFTAVCSFSQDIFGFVFGILFFLDIDR
jgi:hypothetical protein